MPILMPEKTIISTLSTGMAGIKAAPDTYLPIIFDSTVLGADYLVTVKDHLAAKKIYFQQGYMVNEQKLPGFYVVPPGLQPAEDIIGEYGADEDPEEDAETGTEILVQGNNYSLRIIAASVNMDVTLFLEAIARYILLSSSQMLSDVYNFHDFRLSVTDIDPIYQFLPDHLYYRTIMLSFMAFDSWMATYPIITDVIAYGKFNSTETHVTIEV